MAKVGNGKYLELTSKESAIADSQELATRLEIMQLQADNTESGAKVLSEKLESLQGSEYFVSKFTDNAKLIAARIIAAKEGKNNAEIKNVTADNLSAKQIEQVEKFVSALI